MKKIIGLFLLLVLIIAGCSNDNTKTPDNSNVNDGEVKGDITVWGWDVAAATMEETVEMFNEEYPDINVTVEDFGSGDLYEKLTVGLVSRGSGLPDVVLMEDERIPGYYNQFPEGFLSLSELGYKEHVDLFGDSKLENVTFDDEIMAAPWDIGPAVMFYRTDIFEEAGVNAEDIITWNDFLEAGIKIKEETGVKMLPIDIPNYAGVFEMMMQQQGLSYYDENNEIAVDSEEAIKSMEMITKFHEEDIILNNSGWDGIVTATVNGDVATVPYGVWYTGSIMDQGPDLSGKWDIFFLPEFETGGTRYANVGGASLAIPSSTENPEAAYAFVEFFTTNVDAQLHGFENYGLFPSLESTYNTEVIAEDSEYFNNQPIFKQIADIVEDVPAININEHYGEVTKLMADTQAEILLENKEVEDALKALKKEIENID